MATEGADPRIRHKAEKRELLIAVRKMRADRDKMGKKLVERERYLEITKEAAALEKEFKVSYLFPSSPTQPHNRLCFQRFGIY